MGSAQRVGNVIGWALPGALSLFATYERLKSSSRRRISAERAGGNEPKADTSELSKLASERKRLGKEVATLDKSISKFIARQSAKNPLDPSRETVFLIVTSGQAVRGFLLTDAMARLRSRFNVVIFSQYAYSRQFVEDHSQPNVHIIPWFSKFKSRLSNVFQYYLIQTSGSSTHRSWLSNLDARVKGEEKLHGMSESAAKRRFGLHERQRRMSARLGRVLGAKGLINLFHGYFLSYLPDGMLQRIFDHYRPALVVSTTAHHVSAWPLTHYARSKNIGTLACVLSWDNCTTKVTFDPYCETYAVWSDEMAEEVRRYFPFISPELVVAGTPILDMYYQDGLLTPRDELVQSVGLPPELPYIFYATNTPAAMPDEPELISDYWDVLSRTSLHGKVGLLVRLHPADDINRYAALRGRHNLVVTVANESGDSSEDDGLEAWIPDRKGMSFLLSSLKHAAVSINVASTMSLESFAAGIPTINVAFRARPEVREKFLWRFEMYHTSEHYRALVENDAVAIARSMDELVAQTLDALEFGNRREAGMQKTLAQKVAFRDGASAQRFSDLVEKLVGPKNGAADRPRASIAELAA